MDSKAPAGAASPPPTLDDDLKAKQDTLVKFKQEIEQLQIEINVLQTKIADIKQAVGNYDQQALQKQLNDTNKSIAQKSGIAEAAIKDKIEEIGAKIKKFDEDIKDQEHTIGTAKLAYTKATDDVGTADVNAQTKQAEFDRIKKTRSDIDVALKDARSLLDLASKAEGASDYVSVYFHAREAKSVADKVTIPSLEDLTKSLRSAQDDAEKAKSDVSEKKATADGLLAAFTEAKKKYDIAQASRRTELLNILKQ